MSGQRVLITGAGGFVCSAITAALLGKGWQVVAVDQHFDNEMKAALTARWGKQLNIIQSDIAQLPAIEVDSVIHGAAITASPEELNQTPESNFRANLDPLLSMCEWVEKHRVQRALFISSSAVYAQTDTGPVVEADPAIPLGLYAVAKHTMETLIRTLHTQYKRDVATIRLSNIYGIDEKARPSRPRSSLIGRMIQQAIETGIVTAYRDDPARDWTFAPDIGKAVDALLNQPVIAHSLYNVASEQTFSPVEIAEIIHSHIPAIRLDIRDGSDPTMPPLTRRGYLSHQRLEADIGFQEWTPFSEGIRQALHHRQTEFSSL